MAASPIAMTPVITPVIECCASAALVFSSAFLLSSSAAQIVIQYFHGYGENLLDYNREKSVFRVGLGF